MSQIGEMTEVTSPAELREIVGETSQLVRRKDIGRIDDHMRDFIAASPFVLLATASSDGTCDVSPKGDPQGSVLVLDEHTLVIADRPGNRRIDSLLNILANPQAGLLFLVPRTDEVLRVNGAASVVREAPFLADLAVRGRVPKLAVVVRVQEAYFHCPKALKRSGLWHPDGWPQVRKVATLGRILHDELAADQAAGLAGTSVAELDAALDTSAERNLY